MSDRMTFGPPRYFRPVSILHRHGFLGGPQFYKETTDPAADPVVVEAVREGRLPLHVARESSENER